MFHSSHQNNDLAEEWRRMHNTLSPWKSSSSEPPYRCCTGDQTSDVRNKRPMSGITNSPTSCKSNPLRCFQLEWALQIFTIQSKRQHSKGKNLSCFLVIRYQRRGFSHFEYRSDIGLLNHPQETSKPVIQEMWLKMPSRLQQCLALHYHTPTQDTCPWVHRAHTKGTIKGPE